MRVRACYRGRVWDEAVAADRVADGRLLAVRPRRQRQGPQEAAQGASALGAQARPAGVRGNILKKKKKKESQFNFSLKGKIPSLRGDSTN